MIISVSDTAYYGWHVAKFNTKYDLIDLTKNTDSLFIRVSTNTNRIYELKLNKVGWKARQISYGEYEIKKFNLNFILLNKVFHWSSKKEKKMIVCRQKSILPVDTSVAKFTWDSLAIQIKDLNLFNLRTQNEVDTSKYETLDGISFDIEVSTPSEYKYLAWSNPESASKSFDSMAIQELFELIRFKLYSKETRWFNYSKKRWAN